MDKVSLQQLKDSLPDIQKTKDIRGISINRVGVEEVDFQLNISRKDGTKIPVQAKVDLFSSLKHQLKGVNMSRFVEVLMEWKDEVLTDGGIERLLYRLKDKMGEGVEDVYIKIKFKYFTTKIAPVSKQESMVATDCWFTGVLRNNRFAFSMSADVLSTSNCPCSREISKYGAHGQRSRCTVTVELLPGKKFWLEDFIPLIENQGSCEIYPLLKRVDEKHVTERAYKNAKFVEDVARDISGALQQINRVKKFKIRVCNEESIHHHDAVAYVARKLRGNKWIKDEKGLKS